MALLRSSSADLAVCSLVASVGNNAAVTGAAYDSQKRVSCSGLGAPRPFLRKGDPSVAGLLCKAMSRSRQQHMHKHGKQQSVRVMAAATDAVTDPAVALAIDDNGQPVPAGDELALACPICYEPLIRTGPAGLNRTAVSRSSFACSRCRRSFPSSAGILDLVVTAGTKEYTEAKPAGVETFQSPLVSFVYERGWRQSFARAGFPGPDEEFKMAQSFLSPAIGGTLLDVSCGSGLFSRRFAASGSYRAVIASDFSDNMLRQTAAFFDEDSSLSNAEVALVRADVARLPFVTGSVDAVHAGAALHCWPSPALAVAEISRILRPGGTFVATTFLAMQSPVADELFKPIRKAIVTNSPLVSMRYWEEEELEELCIACGLTNYTKIRRAQFIMICAQKPQ